MLKTILVTILIIFHKKNSIRKVSVLTTVCHEFCFINQKVFLDFGSLSASKQEFSKNAFSGLFNNLYGALLKNPIMDLLLAQYLLDPEKPCRTLENFHERFDLLEVTILSLI